MDTVAAGFWGAFFGTAVLMLAVSLALFVRWRQRVALMAGLSALVSAGFVVAYLGWLPLETAVEARLLAYSAVIAAVSLGLMLLSLLGLLRFPASAPRSVLALALPGIAVIAIGWSLEPRPAFALGS